jgi:Mg-chelatase subunit ChlD
MTDKIVPTSPPTGLTLTGGKLKSTSTPFQARVNQAKASQPDASSMPNRLCLMLDRSSSMASYVDARNDAGKDKSKIDLLREAMDNFVNRCDFNNTSLAVETFPPQLELALTSVAVMITSSVQGLSASGNTPMKACVERCLEKIPMTRGIIVSDGEATDWYDAVYNFDDVEEPQKQPKDNILSKYKSADIPIDCVHIGDSSSGEERLRRIAKETGGIYLKFTDVNAFASAFAYLTPGYRAMLTDGRMSADQIGAKEVLR